MTSLPPGVDPHTIPLVPPPVGVIPNFKNSPSIETTAIVVISITIGLEVFFLTVRLHSNVKKFQTLMADDWMAIAAMLFSLSLAFVLLYLRSTARHFWNISVAMWTIDFTKVIFAEVLLTGPALFTGKAALLLLYYRIFSPNSSFRWKIYVTFTIALLSNLAMVPVEAVFCSPPHGDWSKTNPNCDKTYSFAVFNGTMNVIIDLTAFYLPIPLVLKLHMSLRRKLGVLAIFATGLLAIVASAVNLSNRVYMYQDIDSGYAGYITTLCSFVEVAAGVICSSMPAMTSFSISHMFTNSFFTSMRSRLFHPKSSKSDKSIKFSASVKHKRANLASSFANGFHLDSFTQLRDDRCVYRDGVAFPIGTIKTTILAGEPSRDLENGTIAKSVTMEQSSDTS